MQKGFVPLIFLPFILVGLVFVYGIYWYTGTILHSPSTPTQVQNPVITSQTPQPTQSPNPII